MQRGVFTTQAHSPSWQPRLPNNIGAGGGGGGGTAPGSASLGNGGAEWIRYWRHLERRWNSVCRLQHQYQSIYRQRWRRRFRLVLQQNPAVRVVPQALLTTQFSNTGGGTTTVSPTITSVTSSTTNGTYKVGDTVSIQINFSAR